MPGNSIGKSFVVTTFGESHGPAIGCIVDGCPPGLQLEAADIQPDLDRRRPGRSRYTTQRREPDTVEIVSGVFAGLTTGMPIALLIRNQDQRSRDYEDIKDRYRPGHADYTYEKKYGFRDYRGGGRSSARETATRVAAGAIAKKYLAQKTGMKIFAWLAQMGDLKLELKDPSIINSNPFFCPDPDQLPACEALIEKLRRDGDSVGARINAVVQQVPVGLGEPVFDRLDADIAQAMMSIGAAKGVEIGDGFAVVSQNGSQHRDGISDTGFVSNHAGGVLGGISSGQDILVSVALKPTSSIRIPGQTINQAGDNVEVVTRGRHDPCVGIRATPIVEAMLALVLMDHLLRQRAQNADFIYGGPIKPEGE